MTPATFWDLRNATLAVRQRMGDNAISTRVKAGLVQVVRVTYPNGKRRASVVEPMAPYMSVDDAVVFLLTLGA